VKKVRAAAFDGNATGLALTWAAFDEQSRDFWTQMDSLMSMLDSIMAEDVDA
jgi:type I restriction enzyme M protein